MTLSVQAARSEASNHTNSGRRILGLDGLRAVAVIAVLLFHTNSSPLAGGYLGVDLFFVLSGFLITSILLGEVRSAGRIALGAFWLRRARRLAPALVLLLVVLGVVRWSLPPSLGEVWRADILAALTYTTNWWEILQAGDYFAQFGPASPVLHTWSLAIEEQFYLLFAVFMALVARYALRRRTVLTLLMAATAGSIATLQWALTTGAVSWAYYATVPRLQALLIGAMLAVLGYVGVRGLWRNAAGVVGMMGMTILAWGLWPATFAPTYTVFALCAAAVVWSVVGNGWLATVLSWRPLVMLGVISYGVYLWHWPIFLWLQADVTSVQAELASWLLTLAVATASYFVVELPVRRGRFTRMTAAKQWAAYGLAASAVVLLVLVPSRNPGPETTLPSDDEVAALARPGQPQPTTGATTPRPARQWPADRQVPQRILTNGDSTVLAFSARFPYDKYPGRDVGGAALLGCGFSPLPYYPTEGVLPPPAECENWRDEWRSWNERIDAEVVVTAVSAWDTFDRLQDGQRLNAGTLLFDRSFAVAFESGLRIASRGGKVPVYVMGMPCFASKKADAQYRNDPVRRQHLNSLAQAVVSRVRGAHYVDLTAFTCDEGTGISKDRSNALFLDGVHWSPQGGRAMWSLLLQRWQADGVMKQSGRA